MTFRFENATGLQRRNVAAEVRATADFKIGGIAASYMTHSADLGGFIEQLAPGCFTKSLREKADVKALFNHDPNVILGRTKSSTLTLADSPQGLRWECQLDPANQQHMNLYASIKRGDIDECSFAFTVPDGGDSWQDNGATSERGQKVPLRTIRNCDLRDVSAVCFPAYQKGTSVGARSAPAYGKPVLRYTPSEETKDKLRRAQAAVIGDLVAADMRDFTAEEVSSANKHIKTKLGIALAEKGYHYIKHDSTHAYALPLAVFSENPDISNDSAMKKARKVRYTMGIDGVNLGEFQDICDEDDCRCDWNTLESLRDSAKLRARMRGAAGIITR